MLVIVFDSENVKALFRRGKAYCELNEGSKARTDLTECQRLDGTTSAQVNKLLAELAKQEKLKNEHDKKTYANLFASKEYIHGDSGE